MGKNQSASNLPNIIKQDANGSITFMHGNTMLMQVSSSGAITTTGVISGSNALSASYAVSASAAASAVTAVTAQTASFANAFTVAGTLTAQTLVVQTITSSVDFVTGSTRFGSIAANTHQFTGSLLVTGSISNATYISYVRSNTISPDNNITNNYQGYGGYWALRTDTSNNFNLDVYNNGAPKTALNITQAGAATFTSSINAGSLIGVSNNGAQDVVLSATSNYTDGYRAALRLNNTYTGGKNWEVYSTNNSDGVFGGGRFAIRNTTDSINAMVITSAGNIGIGTVSPSSKLVIYKGVNGGIIGKISDTAITIDSQDYGASTWNAQIGFGYPNFGFTYNPVAIAFIPTFASGAGYADLAFYTRAANTDTAPSERLRITSAGQVGIGLTNPGGFVLNVQSVSANNSSTPHQIALFGNSVSGAVRGYLYIGSSAGIDWLVGKDTSGAGDYRFNLSLYTGEQRMILYTNGNYSFAGSNVSDLRLKSNINTLSVNALDKISQFVPKSYYMTDHPDQIRYGFIAQEIKEILPDLVSGEEKEQEYLGLDYNGVLAVAVKAIQELKAENDTLKEILQRNNIQ